MRRRGGETSLQIAACHRRLLCNLGAASVKKEREEKKKKKRGTKGGGGRIPGRAEKREGPHPFAGFGEGLAQISSPTGIGVGRRRREGRKPARYRGCGSRGGIRGIRLWHVQKRFLCFLHIHLKTRKKKKKRRGDLRNSRKKTRAQGQKIKIPFLFRCVRNEEGRRGGETACRPNQNHKKQRDCARHPPLSSTSSQNNMSRKKKRKERGGEKEGKKRTC